jgi:hypothetical protein
MCVERDRGRSRHIPAEPSTAGRVIALLPPTSKVSAWASALAATASRMSGVACSMLRPASSTSPRSARPSFQARARFPRHSGRSVATYRGAVAAPGRRRPGVNRSCRERGATRPTGASRPAVRRDRSDWANPPCFDRSNSPRLRRRTCGTGCSSTATSRPSRNGRQCARASRNAAIGIADGKVVRVGKRTELAGFRAKQVDALAARG